MIKIRNFAFITSLVALFAGIWLLLEYHDKTEAARPLSPSYKLLGAKPVSMPISQTQQREKQVVKGMLITPASSYEDLIKIAKELQARYKYKHIDYIQLSVHNPNTGLYEDLPYEPVSKAMLQIACTNRGKSELQANKPIVVTIHN
ncbi:hypothetical protein MUG87_05230 [Ectobacillus sp. JY-23]|uniref:hypothetical protein n=1 Tax=Ectobacillus sp. JY-23 TaxID=2933872 RepID=UPI001FF29C0E|nr:hypothetical protein [Ectobacillus sp. JY-23]UOY93528.1 hypothetical protein MUG87_05230 [Ectobacillus sp. JY-23]